MLLINHPFLASFEGVYQKGLRPVSDNEISFFLDGHWVDVYQPRLNPLSKKNKVPGYFFRFPQVVSSSIRVTCQRMETIRSFNAPASG